MYDATNLTPGPLLMAALFVVLMGGGFVVSVLIMGGVGTLLAKVTKSPVAVFFLLVAIVIALGVFA